MFNTEVTDHGLGAWLVQQLIAPIAPIAWMLITAGFPEALKKVRGESVGNFAALIGSVIFVWGFGSVLGYWVGLKCPNAVVTGRWVWIIPSLLFILLFVLEATRVTGDVLLSEFFDISDPDLTVMFSTLPTWSSISYAVTLTMASLKAKSQTNAYPG